MCQFPLCKYPGEPWCIHHAKHFAKPQEKSTTNRIRPLSKKRQKLQVEYRKLVSKMMEQSDRCEVMAPGCLGKANGMQHKQKRSVKNLMDLNNLMRCCGSCQTWIEENPVLARQKGFEISRFKK